MKNQLHLVFVLGLIASFALFMAGCPANDDDDDDAADDDAADDDAADDDAADDDAADDDAADDDTGDDDTGDDDTSDDDTGDDDTGVADNTIYEVQGGAIAMDTEVFLANVVMTSPMAASPPGFFIQEPGSEADPEYSGIFVYIADNQVAEDLAGSVAIGNTVDITGTYTEYYDLSEISIDETADLALTGTGTVNPVDVAACDVGTGGGSMEAYEGVLVRVSNVTVTNEDLGFGEFEVEGCLSVDDLFYAATPALDTVFSSITGPMNYTYSAAKIEPRGESDLAQ